MSSAPFELALHTWFSTWIGTLGESLTDGKAWARPALVFVRDDPGRKTAGISRDQTGTARIKLSASFLEQVETEIGEAGDAVSAACLDGLDGESGHGDARDRLLVAIRDLAGVFVLLHEAFHLFCGHFDAGRASRARFSYEEGKPHPGATPATSTASGETKIDVAWTQSYYLELEADDSALQCLMQTSMTASLRGFLESLSTPADEADAGRDALYLLETQERVLGFRALISAVWIVIRLLERRRGAAIRKRFRTHPLPGARMLAAFFTIMEQYAELDAPDVEASGRKAHRLSQDSQVADLKAFFSGVLGPVLRVAWPMRDHDAVRDGFETFSVTFAIELGRMFLGKGPETEAGRELDRIERLRVPMSAWLEPHRYFGHELPDT